jgi:glycine cleavage system aminomethyltransferase T
MSEFDLTLERERLAEVRHGAVVVTTEPAVFRVQGPGALTCLQGLLTNDLVKPGDNSLVYGALLTPKGALVVDYWVIRQCMTPRSSCFAVSYRRDSPRWWISPVRPEQHG